MKKDHIVDEHQLHAIIERKITGVMREMQDAGWPAEDVAVAIQTVVQKRWLDAADALRDAREAVPDGFVSDGHEG